MTVGIALKDKKNNRIILGSDKQETIGQYKETILGSKIITREIRVIDEEIITNKKIYFQIAGYGYYESYLKYELSIPDYNCEDNFIKYLYTELITELREGLQEKNLIYTSNEVVNSKSNINIIFDGEIYELSSSFGVAQIKDYNIIGSGYSIALGSIYTNLHFHPGMDSLEVVKQAIIACGVNTIYCDMNTDIKIIEL